MQHMRYFTLMGLAWVLLILPNPVFAQTYAYIPKADGSGGSAVIRVNTSNSDTDEIALSECTTAYGVAVAPDGSYVLVTCRDNDRLYKIAGTNFDGPGSPQYRDVGDIPLGVAVDSRGHYGYVAANGDDSVTEFVMSTFAQNDTITAGNGPGAAAAFYDETADETVVYLANQGDTTISVIRDGALETPIEVDGYPEGLVLSPSGNRLYAAVNHPVSGTTPLAYGELAVISTNEKSVIHRKIIGRNLWGVALGSSGTCIYVTWNENDDRGRVSLYFPGTDIVRHIDAGRMDQLNAMSVRGVAAAIHGGYAYVISSGNNAVFRVDAAALTIEAVLTAPTDISVTLGAFIGGTPPNAPGSFSAVAESYNKIQLSWSDNATDELGYQIEQRIEGDDTYVRIATTAADAVDYLDTGLNGDTTYEYRIRAFNEAANSKYVQLPEGVTTPEGYFSWCFIGTLLSW